MNPSPIEISRTNRNFVKFQTHALAILGALAPWHFAAAADWDFEPWVALAAVFDDNYGLADTAAEETDVAGAEVDARATIQAASPLSEFRIEPRIRSTFFPDEPDQEATDGFLNVDARRRGERVEAGIRARYSQEDLQRGYLPTTVIESPLGQPPSSDQVAQLNGTVTEQLFVVAPNFEFALGQRQDLTLDLEYVDAQYDGGAEAGYTDYSNLYGAVGFAYRTSPAAAIALRASAADYDPADAALAGSVSYGLNVEWSKKVSETAQFYVRAGVKQTSFDAAGGNESVDETTFSGGAGARWRFEVTDVFVDANTGVDPTPTGTVVQRDQVRLRIVRRLNQVLAVSAGLRAIQDRTIGDRDDSSDQRYVNGLLGFEWRMTQRFALQSSYEYTTREYTNTSSDADSNAVRVTLVYEPGRPPGGPPIAIY